LRKSINLILLNNSNIHILWLEANDKPYDSQRSLNMPSLKGRKWGCEVA
jgi:hypothetical protein